MNQLFIILNTLDEGAVRFNVQHMYKYAETLNGSVVSIVGTDGLSIQVKESPEDIDRLLTESYCTVKRIL